MNPFERTWQDAEVIEPETKLPVSNTYPTALPHDLACAMSDEEVETLRVKYALTPEELDYIVNRPDFRREYSEWRQRLVSEGNSFKLKLRAMSEAYLPQIHTLLHDENVAPSVKADMFKYITRVAELEPAKETATAAANSPTQTRMVISWQDGTGQVAIETGGSN